MTWPWWIGGILLVSASAPFVHTRTRRKIWRGMRKAGKAHYRWRARRRRPVHGPGSWAVPSSRPPARPTATRPGPRPGQSRAVVKAAPIKSTSANATTTGIHGVRNRGQVRQRCSLACRKSSKPATTCDCSCRGRFHGRYVAGSKASIQATPVTRAESAAQRRVNEEMRAARARKKLDQRVAKAKAPERGGRKVS